MWQASLGILYPHDVVRMQLLQALKEYLINHFNVQPAKSDTGTWGNWFPTLE